MAKRFVVMGAGELGFHLARTLQHEGHDLVVIDVDPSKRARIEEELDLLFLTGSGTEIPVLERAGVDQSELFIAASSSEEANLTASILAKDLGAPRTAVRLATSEELTTYRDRYERLFRADLLLSPQVLATTRVLNVVLGHNTNEIDFLAQGKIQLRTIEIQPGCPATKSTLRELDLPANALIVGYLESDHELSIPSPDQRPSAGGKALVLCTDDSIRKVEELFSSKLFEPGLVVVAGGGHTGTALARALARRVPKVRVIERDRERAERVAFQLTEVEVIHGDATDPGLLRAERADHADAFIAATGDDETNLLAALVADEAGAGTIVSLVSRTEASRLWDQVGSFHVVSPRYLAAERISDYIRNGYKANMISLEGGALRVIHRRIYDASPVVGVSMLELDPPPGLLVGAIVRGRRVFIPSATDRFEVDDLALLFVHRSELATVQLLFPGRDDDA